MVLLALREDRALRAYQAALASDGIAAHFSPAERSGWLVLDVPEFQRERAVVVLSDLLADDLAHLCAQEPARTVQGAVPLQPAFAAAVSMAACLLFLFYLTGPEAARSAAFAHGELDRIRVLSGEWWRLVTAATLHADLEHVVSNSVFIVLLGWAAAERLGPGVMAACWLGTAVAGNLVSLAAPSIAFSVGASGGVFGLLGVSAGHALRQQPVQAHLGWQRIRTLGGAILLLAFTAFGPHVNLPAHLGGAAAGLLVGLAAGRMVVPAWGQALVGIATAAVVVGAWRF